MKDASNTTVATYQYDYLGRRVSKTVGAVTTRYIYDGWNIITEYTGTTLKKRYTWGMDLSGSMQGAGGVGGLLAVEEVSTLSSYYPTFDGNGNVSEYLDSSGVVQAHYEYDAFGNTTVAIGAKAADFAHRFSTKPLDTETGLYYYGYRYYDPVTGSWPSRDPIEEKGGYNLYGFVTNNSVNLIDVLGMSGLVYSTDVTLETKPTLTKDGECGGFVRQIEWIVRTAIKKWRKGLVIQHIKWGGSYTDIRTGTVYPVNADFTEYFNYPSKKTDTFLQAARGNCTKGRVTLDAEAAYWPEARLQPGSTRPGGISGGLPISDGNAFDQIRGNPLISGKIVRKLIITWDCTTPDKYDSKTQVQEQ